NVRPLLALRQSTPADDTHLIHVVRIALRDQLKPAGVWPGLESLNLTERDRRDIADVAPGDHSPEAAAFLLDHLQRLSEPSENRLRFVHHIARYGSLDRMGTLTEVVRHTEKPSDPVGVELLKAIHQGLQERGAPPSPEIRQLTVERAQSLL